MSAAAATAVVDKGTTAAYRDKLAGLLGQRDPFSVLASTADEIGKLFAPHPAEKLRRRPYEGKWTPTEIIGHLCDSEWVYGYRVRLILCEEKPTILSMDQDLWVLGQRYNERDAGELLADFRSLRAVNLKLWRGVRPEQMARYGRHNERGEESLGAMLKMLAGHDLSHIDQIRRYIAALA
ncbi:DinB superfamily protein [Phycisphaerae bacterium RAS1]|nr:DinB superfamily protein [Phycisphaerae bacterium RAS1]